MIGGNSFEEEPASPRGSGSLPSVASPTSSRGSRRSIAASFEGFKKDDKGERHAFQYPKGPEFDEEKASEGGVSEADHGIPPFQYPPSEPSVKGDSPSVRDEVKSESSHIGSLHVAQGEDELSAARSAAKSRKRKVYALAIVVAILVVVLATLIGIMVSSKKKYEGYAAQYAGLQGPPPGYEGGPPPGYEGGPPQFVTDEAQAPPQFEDGQPQMPTDGAPPSLETAPGAVPEEDVAPDFDAPEIFPDGSIFEKEETEDEADVATETAVETPVEVEGPPGIESPPAFDVAIAAPTPAPTSTGSPVADGAEENAFAIWDPENYDENRDELGEDHGCWDSFADAMCCGIGMFCD